MDKDLPLALSMTIGGGIIAAQNQNGSIWLGMLCGLGVAVFVLGIDYGLKAIFPGYRRARNRE